MFDGGFGFGQAQLARDQAGKQGVAKGGEGLGLLLIIVVFITAWPSNYPEIRIPKALFGASLLQRNRKA